MPQLRPNGTTTIAGVAGSYIFSPVTALAPGQAAHRDVLVLTFRALE